MDQHIDHEARYAPVQARIDAMAAKRHNARVAAAEARRAAREAAVRATVAQAVREALGRTAAVTEVAPTAGTSVVESAPVVETKPLHQMSPDEFREHARQTWQQVGESLHSPLWTDRQPLTLTEFLARGH